MNIEELRFYCISKKEVTEGLPFDEDTLVFKAMDKIFALTNLNSNDMSVTLKCDPQYAVELREKYVSDVFPGWHMSKKHWNTINYSGGLSDHFVKELIDHSYDMVVNGFTKTLKEKLKNDSSSFD